MPRRSRDDIRPLVRIRDKPVEREASATFSNELGRHRVLREYDRKYYYEEEDIYLVKYPLVQKNFVRWADKLTEFDRRFDSFSYEVFDKLISNFEVSKCVECSERDRRTGEKCIDENADGVLHRMIVVGCRVTHSGLSELVNRIDVSNSKLEKQLRLYREIDLIVNEAKATSSRAGFIEFNPMVAWRGSSEHREAYLDMKRTSDTILSPSWRKTLIT